MNESTKNPGGQTSGPNFESNSKSDSTSKDTENQANNKGGAGYNKSSKAGNINIHKISKTELAIGIWLYHKTKSGDYELSGIYMVGLYKKLASDGFFNLKYGDNLYLVRIVGQKIEIIEPKYIRRYIHQNIIENDKPHDFKYGKKRIKSTPEKRADKYSNQFKTKIDSAFVDLLPYYEGIIMGDTRHASFYYFENCVVSASKSGREIINYDHLDGKAVFERQIISHDFKYRKDGKDCQFAKFIANVANHDESAIKAYCTAIGYLTHNYTERINRYAVIGLDGGINDPDRHNGRRGKSLLYQALEKTRKTKVIDGKALDNRNRFKYQGVDIDIQIIVLDDVRKEFSLADLYSQITEGVSTESKFKDKKDFPETRNPKFYITTNGYLKGTGDSDLLRQIILLFGDHYSRKSTKASDNPVKDEHGGVFFSEDWDNDDWDRFYSYMIDCSVLYHQEGLHEHIWPQYEINLLSRETSIEFADWSLNCESFEVDTKYYNNLVRSEFQVYLQSTDVSSEASTAPKISEKLFGIYIRAYARIKKLQYESFKDGKGRGFRLLSRR